MSSRLEVISNHLQPASDALSLTSCLGRVGVRAADDIVIVSCVRTPICKAKRGAFRATGADSLLAPLLSHVLASVPAVKPAQIGDVVIGSVLPRSSQGATEVRIACLLAGLPESVPCHTVNRQCSSGLQAIASVAAALRAGYYEFGIAGGAESMSLNAMGWDGAINESAMAHPVASGCYLPMGQTSENVAERFHISRADQDAAAAHSHARALAAQQAGLYKSEIVPIHLPPSEAHPNGATISADEGPRATPLEALAKLKPAFKPDGSTTAGNASQVSDGAAVALLCRRASAQRLGLPVMGVLRSFSAVGVDPAVMGVGPAYAIPEAVRMAGIELKDVGLFEVNEAFASQYVYSLRKLGIKEEIVNVKGGAIALGHPLGCTGCRQMATLLPEMKRRKVKYGVISMCIGSGMGAAAVVEHEF